MCGREQGGALLAGWIHYSVFPILCVSAACGQCVFLPGCIEDMLFVSMQLLECDIHFLPSSHSPHSCCLFNVFFSFSDLWECHDSSRTERRSQTNGEPAERTPHKNPGEKLSPGKLKDELCADISFLKCSCSVSYCSICLQALFSEGLTWQVAREDAGDFQPSLPGQEPVVVTTSCHHPVQSAVFLVRAKSGNCCWNDMLKFLTQA